MIQILATELSRANGGVTPLVVLADLEHIIRKRELIEGQ